MPLTPLLCKSSVGVRSLRRFAALSRRRPLVARRRRLWPQVVRTFPRQRRHEPGRRLRRLLLRLLSGGGRRSVRMRRRLDDEAGGLLAAQRVAKAVDLVLEGHEDGDDVGQRLVVLADHQQDVSDVLP